MEFRYQCFRIRRKAPMKKFFFATMSTLLLSFIGGANVRTTINPYTSAPAAPASGVVIDFEDLAPGGPGGAGSPVIVTNQYADKGIIFNSPVALDYSKGPFSVPGFAHS